MFYCSLKYIQFYRLFSIKLRKCNSHTLVDKNKQEFILLCKKVLLINNNLFLYNIKCTVILIHKQIFFADKQTVKKKTHMSFLNPSLKSKVNQFYVFITFKSKFNKRIDHTNLIIRPHLWQNENGFVLIRTHQSVLTEKLAVSIYKGFIML